MYQIFPLISESYHTFLSSTTHLMSKLRNVFDDTVLFCCWNRYSLFLQKPTQDISLLRILQLSHIVLHSCQPVLCVCVCVCVCVCARTRIFCIVKIEPVSISSSFLYNIFRLDVHYVCMLVQRFELQGRRFTNFHYYYYCVAHPQVVCNCAQAEGMSQNVTACSISAREKHMAQPSLQSSQHRLVKRLTERSNKTVNSLIWMSLLFFPLTVV